MELQLALSFLGASILLSLMPGPDNIFVLTESLIKGKKNGISISIGLSLGVLVHTTAAATGLSIIIQKSALVFSTIKYLGAIYLFYLAYLALKEKKHTIAFGIDKLKENSNVIKLIRKGFLMNVLNPKVSLFFIAFLPQFVSYDGYNVTIQLVILGFIFMLQALMIFSIIAVTSSKLNKYINKPRFWKITKWCKTTVLLILGLFLMLSKK